MGKRPWNRKGRDRYSRLVPLLRPKVGQVVYWQHTWYWEGQPSVYWRKGVIEVIRRRTIAIVRDSYGHETIIATGMLFESKGPT